MAIDYTQLEARLGSVHLARRLRLQAEHAAHRMVPRRARLHLENWSWVPQLLAIGLQCCGLRERSLRNAARIEVREHQVRLAGLPSAFEGFVLLHLSDLHLDGSDAIFAAIMQVVVGLRYDACVITGDFRFDTRGPYDLALRRMAELGRRLHGPVYGILGNHDYVEMLPGLEATGVSMLVNESASICRNGTQIHVAGVDDTHFYLSDNLDKALTPLPHGGVKILLSHSPELYREACHAGVDLMLSGHTHAGQVCLPGGVPIITNAACPRRLCRGAWRFGPMLGYTSAGTGSSGLDARLNCPPEAVLHRLSRALDSSR